MSQERLYSSLTSEEKKALSKEFYQIKSAFITRIALFVMAAAVLVMLISFIIIWATQSLEAASVLTSGLSVMAITLILFSIVSDTRYREWLKTEKGIIKKQV